MLISRKRGNSKLQLSYKYIDNIGKAASKGTIMVSNASTVDNDIEVVPESSGNTIDITASDEDDEICEVEHLRKLFIGGLSGETTDVSLRKFFSKWGNVVDSVVMRDPVTKRSRGFGFVTYTKASMIDKAQASRPHIIDGKKVESKRALPRPEPSVAETKKSISVKKLFVGGLKDDHDEECLKEYFSEFGKVVSVNILVDNTTGKRRGFAFIEYDDYDAVDKAILQKTHLIKYVLVDVRKSIYTQDPKKTPEKDAGRKQDSKNQDNKPDMRMRSGQYNNMQRNAYPRGYQNMNRPPVPPPPAPQQQQYQQMPPYQQVPPSNYKQWGPPPQHAQGPPQQPAPYAPPPPHPQQQYQQSMPPHNYGAYQQAPMPPAHTPAPPPNWNSYGPHMGGNNWNAPAAQAAVPNPPPPPTWHNNNWGPPPPPAAGPPPPAPMPAANQPPPNWQQPPPPQNSGPPQPHQQPPAMYQPHQQQQPPPPPPLPNNFGNGYQQNYGGGPTKHPNAYTNRMNPYSAHPNQYNNAPAQGYGNHPMPNGSKYRH